VGCRGREMAREVAVATGEQECQDVRRSIRWVLARGRSGDGRERRAGHEAASRLLGLGGCRVGDL
jgi:hypothetical protein